MWILLPPFHLFCCMNRVSVVTICFNNLEDVKRSCASVDCQEVAPFEHLIIDGSSKPDIKQWLEGNKQPAWRRWVCERDKGIADAFNKGIRNAQGDYIQMLNSGDTLYDASVIGRVVKTLEQNPNAAWLNGRLHLYRGGTRTVAGKAFQKSMLYRGMHGVFHPTMFVRRDVYAKHGEYDLSIKYAMDYDYICRLADEPSVFLDYPVATFDPSGISSVQYVPSTKEMLAVYRKYFGGSLKQTLWGWRLLILHNLLNSGIGKALYAIKVKAGMQKV